MARPCRSCGQAPAAHFRDGYWHPPAGCRIVERAKLSAKASEWLRKPAPPRVRYYALPGAKTVALTPGTNIYAINQIILKAGAAGIVPNEILAQLQKLKGKERITTKELANYLAKLRYQGAVASAPIK